MADEPEGVAAHLHEHFREQQEMLRDGCEDFDKGRKHAAKRLAVTLRILLHHRGQSRALLVQLGVQDRLEFVESSGRPNPANHLGENTLVFLMTKQEGGALRAEWVPRCTLPPRPGLADVLLPFDEWWQMPVVNDRKGGSFTRETLVLTVANKDGGAHVDPLIPADYHGLSRGNSLGWNVHDADGDRPMTDNPVPPSLRQVAQEVLDTLNRHVHLLPT